MIFTTGETTEDLMTKYNPQGSLLRNVQFRMLDMLLYIDKICKEQDIDYMLGCGTALGAVRHGGFIPWDDDLDLFLDYKNYKKLCKYLLKNPHPQFKLHSSKTDSNYLGTWNSLRDTKSKYLQDSVLHNKRKYQGLQIDFFPLDKGGFLFLRKISWDMYYYMVYKMTGVSFLISKLFYYILSYIVFPIFRSFNTFGNKCVYSLTYGCGDPYKEFPSEVLFPTKDIEFENHIFKGPADVKRYLEILYDDYMSLPDANNRSSHEAKYQIWE